MNPRVLLRTDPTGRNILRRSAGCAPRSSAILAPAACRRRSLRLADDILRSLESRPTINNKTMFASLQGGSSIAGHSGFQATFEKLVGEYCTAYAVRASIDLDEIDTARQIEQSNQQIDCKAACWCLLSWDRSDFSPHKYSLNTLELLEVRSCLFGGRGSGLCRRLTWVLTASP